MDGFGFDSETRNTKGGVATFPKKNYKRINDCFVEQDLGSCKIIYKLK